jgi:hypothetical protein
MASRQRKGRPLELRDTMIARIVVAPGTLATRNVAHFEDLSVPCRSLACLTGERLLTQGSNQRLQMRASKAVRPTGGD